MRRSFSRPTLLLLLALLAPLAGACRIAETALDPTAAPTRRPAVTAVAPVGPPAPTRAAPAETDTMVPAPTRPASPTFPVGPAAWTLTILHTGEVYGDVLPCG